MNKEKPNLELAFCSTIHAGYWKCQAPYYEESGTGPTRSDAIIDWVVQNSEAIDAGPKPKPNGPRSLYTEKQLQQIRDAWPKVCVLEGFTPKQVLSKARTMGLKREHPRNGGRPKGSFNKETRNTEHRTVKPLKKLSKKQTKSLGDYASWLNRHS